MVWGIIFYRFFKAVDEPNAIPTYRKPLTNKESAKSNAGMPLLLNYRDPFLGTAYRAIVVKSGTSFNRGIRQKKPKPAPVVIDWNFAQLVGIINSQNNKNKVVILKHREKEYLLKEGESIEEVQLQKIYKDSIKVTYMGQTHFYKK